MVLHDERHYYSSNTSQSGVTGGNLTGQCDRIGSEGASEGQSPN